ncbi:cation diffusion facilitator family transporter [Dielma fastidiosa]|uniref:Cation diffusion facilitator family transporter n=1 Tax=Dielma fastidiosa TaxID=1034346 RepID=A0AB35UMI2_9FIRM|nr:cation diffusion facilitator family transporter [Dielma fastidiosa]MDY5168151.1 cation diffusion facilitator family transporter [Dielma fastidiosa]
MTTENKTPCEMAISTADKNEAVIIRKLSMVSLIGNTALSGFKMFAGIAGNSGAMISDAIHSFSDVLTTLIAWIGVKVSKKAADDSHPYGHERLECVASLILGLVLMATGLGVGKVGIENIIANQYDALAVPKAIALAAAVFSIIGKEAMFWYTRHYARIIHSSAFMADAWHHRSDALSSIGSLIGIAGAMLGYPVMDSIASVVICLFILKVAYDISKDALIKMLDTSCGEDYEEQLTSFIAEKESVLSVDMLHSRMFGNKVYIDLEISVDGNKSLREAHEVAELIHKDVEHNYPEIKHIMIHVNPANE